MLNEDPAGVPCASRARLTERRTFWPLGGKNRSCMYKDEGCMGYNG